MGPGGKLLHPQFEDCSKREHYVVHGDHSMVYFLEKMQVKAVMSFDQSCVAM